MGVPKLAKWLRDHHVLGKAFSKRTPRVKTLALDLNGLIHPVAQKAEKYDDIAPAVVEDIKRLVTRIKPTQKLIVAVDGVAPMAKMVQQRKRRFLSHAQPGEIDEFLTIDSDVPEIDTNFISPGTRFMATLHRLLLQELPKLNITTVYSSYLVPGEGEHKIVQLIRDDITKDNTVLIHSADADMIMISLMLLTTKKLNLHIMRETQFGIEYINTNTMYDAIRKALPFQYSIESLVSIVSLIGNDFLPHFPSMRVIERALDALWDALEKWNKPVCIPGSIDWNAYLDFLKYLNANYVPDLFSSWVNNEELFGRRPIKQPSYMQEQFREFGVTPETRIAWYQHLYAGKPEPGKIIEADIEAVATNFLEGLDWVYRYYANGARSINKRWYYAFHDAPLFSDLISALEKKPNLSAAYFGPPEFMTIYEQLAIILPPSAKSFVPIKLLPIYSRLSPLRDLYPKRVWNQKSGLAVFYQSIFYLPIPDPNKVSAVMKHLNLGDRTGPTRIFPAVKSDEIKRQRVRVPRRNIRLRRLELKPFD